MSDTGRNRKRKTIRIQDTSVKARSFDRNFRRRTSSGPAGSMPVSTGRTYDRNRSTAHNVEKTLANRGRPHMS